MSSQAPESDWGRQYERLRRIYEAFTAALLHELTLLLDDVSSPVSVAQIESRTKTVQSYTEKIRLKGTYTDPINQVTDLSGLRVILYDPADLQVVGRLIRAEFSIDEDNSGIRGSEPGSDRFGYRSEHFIVRLRSGQCELPSLARFEGMRAEVQVRTVMQHAWAAVDHKIRYKGSDEKGASLPPQLERRLYRLSALLEIADEEFAVLQEQRTALSEYVASVAKGDLDVALDGLSLVAYLEEVGADRRWAEIAQRLGYRSPLIDRLEPTVVLNTMRDVGLQGLDDLQAALKSIEPWGEDAVQTILDTTRAEHASGDTFADIVAYRDDILRLLLLCYSRSEQAIAAADFRTDIKHGLFEVTKRNAR